MISSPCAMLMTPITPKVIARPTAARSSTEPSERPYQTFCDRPHIACSRSIVADGGLGGGGELGLIGGCSGVSVCARRCRRGRRRGRPRRPFRRGGVRGEDRRGAASRGRRRRRRRSPARGPLRWRRSPRGRGRRRPARRRRGAWPGRDRAGRAWPIAERTARRRALFTLTAVVERGSTAPRSAPVSGSVALAALPLPVTTMMASSDLRCCRLPSCQRPEEGGCARVAGRPDAR